MASGQRSAPHKQAGPPASFYLHPEEGAGLVRFAFCKRVETLRRAAALLLEAQAAGKL